jgi:selenide,water dikinase
MGGEVLTALNLVMFPSKVPLEILKEILRGGTDKIIEAGGVIAGGHTIVDDTPKYGLAVTGKVHPKKIITNAAAKAGDVLILTKAIGVGIIMAGKKIGEADPEVYQEVLASMKQLNKAGAQIMQKYGVKCATDVTGFGFAGHALKMALGSNVTIKIDSKKVPVFKGTLELIELGCIPGACFRNLEYAEDLCQFEKTLEYNYKMMLLDAQTSGGLLICTPPDSVEAIKKDLVSAGYAYTTVVGEITGKTTKAVSIS